MMHYTELESHGWRKQENYWGEKEGGLRAGRKGLGEAKRKRETHFKKISWIHLETTRNVDAFPLKLVRIPTIQLVDQTTHSA